MKKKRIFRILSMVLAVSMLMGLLAACGEKSPGDIAEPDPEGTVKQLPVTSTKNPDGPNKFDDDSGRETPDGGFAHETFEPRDLSAYKLSDVPALEIPVGPGEFDYSSDADNYEEWVKARNKYWADMNKFAANDPDGPVVTAEDIKDTYLDFTGRTAPYVFEDASLEENSAAYSPLSMYAALCLLSGCAGGETQDEILSFCGLKTPDDAIIMLTGMYRGLQFIDGDNALAIANAIWLNDTYLEAGKLNQGCIDWLNEHYYAGTYKAPFGTDEGEAAVADWMYNETRGLISSRPNAKNDTVSILLNALYYKDSWMDKFSAEMTDTGTFIAASREEQECDFMHKADTGTLYTGNGFQAADLTAMNGTVRFFLPSDGKTVQDLLTDPEFIKTVCDQNLVRDGEYGNIHWTVPKFDASSDLMLTQAMSKAGLSGLNGDYTPLSETLDLFVSQIRQLTRVKADEDGFEAAAVTAVMMTDAAVFEPPKNLYMTLDQPFGFVIFRQGLPLFIGCVNTMK